MMKESLKENDSSSREEEEKKTVSCEDDKSIMR